MGQKFSIFQVCQVKQKEESEESPIPLPEEPIGPTDDILTNPQDGYRYFSEDEQSRYDAVLAVEEPAPVVQAPENWQKSQILGLGSFGRVYFGVNLNTGELIAVKQVPIIGFAYETAHEKVQELQEELEICKSLNHKNIVRYLGSTTDDEFLNIFLEYIPGGSIASLLEKYGRFPETLIRVYTRQILEGLEYLHYHNIIHRDIKGANVLVTNEGICKLADFGAAKKIYGLSDCSQFRSLRGTINWMAPEVMRQEGHGRFADIWSLGCTVIEMATGKPPWSHRTNPIAVFMQVGNSNEPPSIPAELSPEAKDFILSCFRRNPNQRPNVCQLLQHPFVAVKAPKPYIPAPLTDNEILNADEIKQTTASPPVVNKFDTFSVGSMTIEEGKHIQLAQIDSQEAELERPSLEIMDPAHNLKAPFVDIIKTQQTGSIKVSQTPDPGVELVLRREDEEEDEEYSEAEMVFGREDENMVFGREDEDSEEDEESSEADMVFNRQDSPPDEESKDDNMVFRRQESRSEDEVDRQDGLFHRRYTDQEYDELTFEDPVVFCRKDSEKQIGHPEMVLLREENEDEESEQIEEQKSEFRQIPQHNEETIANEADSENEEDKVVEFQSRSSGTLDGSRGSRGQEQVSEDEEES